VKKLEYFEGVIFEAILGLAVYPSLGVEVTDANAARCFRILTFPPTVVFTTPLGAGSSGL